MTAYILILILSIFGGGESGIENYLKAKLPPGSRFNFEILSLPGSLTEFDNRILKINYQREFKSGSGYAYIPVDYYSGGGRNTKSFITVKLHIYKTVLVTQRRIKKGELINKNDLNYEEREVSTLRYDPAADKLIGTDTRAAISIPSNTVLQTNMIERTPDILRGERVNAQFDIGSVSVSFFAKSREEGYEGDIIKVVRDDRTIFRAEVIDSKNVKIIE